MPPTGPDHLLPPDLAGRTRRSLALVATLLTATALTAGANGCSHTTPTETTTPIFDPTTAPPASTTTAATTTTAPPSVEAQVEAAYLRAFHLLATAAMDPRRGSEGFADVMTGDVLETATRTIRRLRDQGIVVRYPEGRPPTPQITAVTRLDATHFELSTCLVDTGVQVREKDGSIVNDKVVSVSATSLVRFDNGHWAAAIETLKHRQQGDGECR